jgi:GAF domain-containing protein
MTIERDFGLAQAKVHRFDLVDGPPLRGANTVVANAARLLGVDCAALIVFDELASVAKLRITSNSKYRNETFLLSGSISSEARETGATTAIDDLSRTHADTPEASILGIGSFLISPVFGAADNPPAALSVFQVRQRVWQERDIQLLKDLAHLVSQELVLKASLDALRILNDERSTRVS